jgi:hypothetical protein
VVERRVGRNGTDKAGNEGGTAVLTPTQWEAMDHLPR